MGLERATPLIKEFAIISLGVALHAAVAWILMRSGASPGQAVGVVLVFYMGIIPCSIVLSALLPGPGLLLAIPVAAWLAWGAVMHTGPADTDAERCMDKQGTHAC
jgi:hypothetical protein